MAGILTFQVVATASPVQLASNPTAGKLLVVSAPSSNTADIVISSSSSATGAFLLPKGTSVQLDGVTDFSQLYISGTAADKVSGITGI